MSSNYSSYLMPSDPAYPTSYRPTPSRSKSEGRTLFSAPQGPVKERFCKAIIQEQSLGEEREYFYSLADDIASIVEALSQLKMRARPGTTDYKLQIWETYWSRGGEPYHTTLDKLDKEGAQHWGRIVERYSKEQQANCEEDCQCYLSDSR